MHGLINRSIEGFLRDTYGDPFWHGVAEASGADVRGFQTIRDYPDSLTYGLLDEAARRLGKPTQEMLEDLGAWLVQLEAIRRLLRFSGRDFTEFLLTLDELPGRAHMILPNLGMPRMISRIDDDGRVIVTMPGCLAGWRSLVAGLIRAMADDYGALCLITVESEAVIVLISHDAFSAGRNFELGAMPQALSGAE